MTQESQNLLFSCRLDNAKLLHTVLTCLAGPSKKEQNMVCEVTEEGLCFMVLGQAKYSQANGMLRKDLFYAFRCGEGGGRFTVNLKSVIECLQIFGLASLHQTSVSMSYLMDSAVFRMSLEEQGVLTTCEIASYTDTEDAMELTALATAFSESEEVFRSILRSEYLREVIGELGDIPGADKASISVSSESPPLQFSTQGTYGYCDLELHANNNTFVHVQCDSDQRWQYTLPALLDSMRGLNHAKDTFLRINSEGILCVQHQIPSSSGNNVFIDFLLCAEEGDGDEYGPSYGEDDAGEMEATLGDVNSGDGGGTEDDEYRSL
mmetsp:Transcript_10312/g.39052  ORF Transcript_10312/g.39052 Transcript_10312/m.39052 type:complete len:321 (-) Transcript_10312:170-1132(-)